MGTFYSNCQVRSDSQEAVVEALTSLLKEPAYVSPSVGGWIGVYPEGGRTGDQDNLAKPLSKRLACGVFTWSVHDDDFFSYSLYEGGKRRDEFNSSPDYFEPVRKSDMARLRGKPEALVPYCLPGIGYTQVQEVLHPPLLAEGDSRLPSEVPLLSDKSVVAFSTLLSITPEEMRADFERDGRRQRYSASHQAGDLAALLGIDWNLSSLDYRQNEESNLDKYLGQGFVFVNSAMLLAKNLQKKLWELPRGVEAMKEAIDSGADVNELTKQGEPFLTLVAFDCDAEVVRLLLNAGADVDAVTTKADKEAWERGVTSLIAAVQGGANAEMGADAANTAPQLETVQILIDAGADVNAKSETGRTALKEAQERLDYFSTRKNDRWRSPEVLAECVARNARLIGMLRAAGATE